MGIACGGASQATPGRGRWPLLAQQVDRPSQDSRQLSVFPLSRDSACVDHVISTQTSDSFRRRRATRWQHTDPAGGVTEHTVGMQTLLDHTYKTSNKWMWGGVAFIFAAAVFFNLLVNLALALLSSALAEDAVLCVDQFST